MGLFCPSPTSALLHPPQPYSPPLASYTAQRGKAGGRAFGAVVGKGGGGRVGGVGGRASLDRLCLQTAKPAAQAKREQARRAAPAGEATRRGGHEGEGTVAGLTRSGETDSEKMTRRG